MKAFKILFLILYSVFLFVTLAIDAFARIYYVSNEGNDVYNGLAHVYQGGLSGPFKTLNKGAGLLKAGDTLYLRGGTYNETFFTGSNGTDNSPIIISSYPGEMAVIDGQDVIPSREWGVLFQIKGDYTVIQNLEVKNSKWMGVVVNGNYSKLINVFSHHNMENGILLTGDSNIAQNCHVWWNCKSNEYGKRSRGGWASGISAARHPRFATIRNCIVWNNWGEGLSTYEAEHTTIEDNIVYDNQTNIYISDATHCLCQRNLVYSTSNNICSQSSGRQVGIAMGDEKYNPPSSDNVIINNLCFGNKHNFYWWQGIAGGGLVNTTIAHNTFVNSLDTTNIQISSGSHLNSKFLNNIILQENSLPISIVNTKAGIYFSHNLWSKTPTSNAHGVADIIANPRLSKIGSISPGSLTPEYFKISKDSPAKNSAILLDAVTIDFFMGDRDPMPDIGAHEFGAKDKKPPLSPNNLRVILSPKN